MEVRKHSCPCCGAPNQIDDPGLHDICQICGWEDDGFPDWENNCNNMTIDQGRILWKQGEPIWKDGRPNTEALERIMSEQNAESAQQ